MSTLHVTFEPSATNLVASEDPMCALTVTNSGRAPTEIPNLDVHNDWPLFEVTDLDRHTVQDLRPALLRGELHIKPMPFREGEGATVSLAPGDARTWRFNLSHQVRLLRPGRYQIRVCLSGDRSAMASAPALLTVGQSEVSRADLTYADGGYSDLFFETWLDRASGSLFLRAARLRTRLLQLQCARIARPRAPVDAIVSVAPNRGATASRCVSWLDGNELHAVDVGLEGVRGHERAVTLPWPAGFIVPHPGKDPESDETVGWVGVDATAGFALAAVTVGADRIDASAPVVLPEGRPLWARSFVRSNGERLALLLSPRERGLALSVLVRDAGGEPLVRPLADWPWTFLAVDASLDGDDTLHGVVLGHPAGEEEHHEASYCSWSLDGAGQLHVARPRRWPDLRPGTLDHLSLGIDGDGTPHALVQSSTGVWGCLTPTRRFEVFPPTQAGQNLHGAPVLRFFARGKIPVLFWHDLDRGLLAVPVGSEIPAFSGPDFEQPAMDD